MTHPLPANRRPRRGFRLPAAVLPDLTPWRASRDFRLLWCSGAVSMFGGFLTFVAVPLQLKELTGSAWAVGATGLVELVPLLACGLYGGALADAVDRRRLVLWTEVLLGLLSLVLLADSLVPRPALWPLYLVAAASSALSGLQRPALDAIMPRVVAPEHLAAAAALKGASWQLGGIAGPALGGLLVASAGTGAAYAVDAATFAVSVAFVARIAPVPPAPGAGPPGLRSLAEGARYAWGRKDLLGTYVVDLAAMFLALPTAVLPFLADDLHAPWALGLLYATVPVGALLVGATSGWTSRVHRHGRAVVLAAAGFGLCTALAGCGGPLWLVLLLLAAAGGCDMVSGVFRSTLWNRTVPDGLRGRLAGIEVLSFTAGPQLGQARAGAVAALTGARTAVWSGGALCVAVVGLLALALPRLTAYDDRTAGHPARPGAPPAAPEAAPPPATVPQAAACEPEAGAAQV
ncbi:MFS transporter [Streptomyces sp. NPDC059740]|uniref:MFS transporter n=1 Tax=Streptomyces sp. NPDC059740 TaxID=3346926 RepID=UPI00364F066C